MIKMNYNEANLCMTAYSKFCDNVGRNELSNSADLQYWVYEQGYLAAMKEIAKVVQLGQSAGQVDLSAQLTAKHTVYQ